MKKLLGFLAAVGLTSTASVSVVACQTTSVLSENNLNKILGEEISFQGKGDFLSEAEIKENIKSQNPKINIDKIEVIKKGLDENNNYLYIARGVDSTYTGQVIIHSEIVKQDLGEIIKVRDFESKTKLNSRELLARVAVENRIKYTNTLQIVEVKSETAANTNQAFYRVSPKVNENYYYTGSVVVSYEWFVEDAKKDLGATISKRDLVTAKEHAGDKNDVFERIMMINNVEYWEELEISEPTANGDNFTYEIKVKAGAINYNPNSAPVKITEATRDSSASKTDLSRLKLASDKIDLGFNEISERLVRENFIITNGIDNDNQLVFEKAPASTFGVSWTDHSEKWVVKAKADSLHYTGSLNFEVINHGLKQLDLGELKLTEYDSGEHWATTSEIITEVNRQVKETKDTDLDFAYLNIKRGAVEVQDKTQTEIVRKRDLTFSGTELGKKHYANEATMANKMHEFVPIDLDKCGIAKDLYSSADEVITKDDLTERIMIENGFEDYLKDEFTLEQIDQPTYDNGIKLNLNLWLIQAKPNSKHMIGSKTITTVLYSAKQFDLKDIVKTEFTSVNALDKDELLRRIVTANDLPTTKDLILEVNKEKSNDSQVVYTLKATRDTYFVNDIEIVNTLHKVEKHNLTEYVNEANNNKQMFTIDQLDQKEFESRFWKTVDIAYIDEIEISKGKENKETGEQEFIIKAKADSLHYEGTVTVINKFYTDKSIDLSNKLQIKTRWFISENGLAFNKDDLLNEFILANKLTNANELQISDALAEGKEQDILNLLNDNEKALLAANKLKVWVVMPKENSTAFKGFTLVFNQINSTEE